jgi:hypothetical protein
VRLLRHPVSLMYAFGMFFLGAGLAVAFYPQIDPWRGLAMFGATVLGAVLVIADGILRQLDAARGTRPGRR